MSGASGEYEPSDARGDSGDQAQDLRSSMELEAIDAARAGRPHGTDELDRGAFSEQLEGPDIEDGLLEGDASDDPVYGGDDVTGVEPPRELVLLAEEDDSLTEEELEVADSVDEDATVSVDDDR